MQEEIKSTIQAIRKNMRLSMDGILSTSMREKGVDYKLNFGVTTPQLREIVKKYTPDKHLAEALWKENVRELRILATLLYPADDFSEETANVWMEDTLGNPELKEQLCMNLLQNVPFSYNLVNKWAISEKDDARLSAYLLFVRLLRIKSVAVTRLLLYPLLDSAVNDTKKESIALKHAALNALKNACRFGQEIGDYILDKIADYKDSEDNTKREIYDAIAFECSLL